MNSPLLTLSPLDVDADAQAADVDVVSRPAVAVAPDARHRVGITDRPPKFLMHAGSHDMAPVVGHVALVVYTFVSEHANRQGQCWIPLADISAGCHIIRDTVVNAQKRLRAAGMIEYQSGTYGRPNKYTVLPPGRWIRPVAGAPRFGAHAGRRHAGVEVVASS
jgi:hypothetical protein